MEPEEISIFMGDREGAARALLDAGVPEAVIEPVLDGARESGVASHPMLINGRIYGAYYAADEYVVSYAQFR